MSEPESKRGGIATNRLLDLLRAQDAEKEMRTQQQIKDKASEAKEESDSDPKQDVETGSQDTPSETGSIKPIHPAEQPSKEPPKDQVSIEAKKSADSDTVDPDTKSAEPVSPPVDPADNSAFLNKIRRVNPAEEAPLSKERKVPREAALASIKDRIKPAKKEILSAFSDQPQTKKEQKPPQKESIAVGQKPKPAPEPASAEPKQPAQTDASVSTIRKSDKGELTERREETAKLQSITMDAHGTGTESKPSPAGSRTKLVKDLSKIEAILHNIDQQQTASSGAATSESIRSGSGSATAKPADIRKFRTIPEFALSDDEKKKLSLAKDDTPRPAAPSPSSARQPDESRQPTQQKTSPSNQKKEGPEPRKGSKLEELLKAKGSEVEVEPEDDEIPLPPAVREPVVKSRKQTVDGKPEPTEEIQAPPESAVPKKDNPGGKPVTELPDNNSGEIPAGNEKILDNMPTADSSVPAIQEKKTEPVSSAPESSENPQPIPVEDGPSTTDENGDIHTSTGFKVSRIRNSDDRRHPVPHVIPENPDISPGKTAVLLQTNSVKSEPDQPEIVVPEPVDESLFYTIPDLEDKKPTRGSLTGFKFLLDESNDRISLYQEDSTVWLLHTLESVKETRILDFKEFSLPYDTGRKTIEEMDLLVDHILDTEVAKDKASKTFAAFTSATHSTKTHVFQTPRLKSKDIQDLVEWHAKKNLPFSSDLAIINWEQIKSSDPHGKDDIILGTAERTAVERSIEQFKKHSIKLRQYSTIPILLWKSFLQNYPDRKNGTYILIHIGEARTFVVIVDQHKLLFAREIAIGAQDLYNAMMQKVMVNSESVKIDLDTAKDILKKYGFPQQRSGITAEYGIDLYKISIFLRPVVERITNEINRSLNYFKKQTPELVWEVALFDGIGSTFPHLLEAVNETLNLKIGYFNPLRGQKVNFSDARVIPDHQLPGYTMNLALLSDNCQRLNILPSRNRTDYRFIFLSKLVMFLAILVIPIYLLSAFWMTAEFKRITEKVANRSEIHSQLSLQKTEMTILQKDIDVLDDYYQLLNNDNTITQFQLKVIRLLGSIVPDDIKLTSLEFTKEQVSPAGAADESVQEILRDVLLINGFVDTDISLAHIHLTNLRIKLEQMPYFTFVKVSVQDSEISGDKFLFSLKLGF